MTYKRQRALTVVLIAALVFSALASSAHTQPTAKVVGGQDAPVGAWPSIVPLLIGGQSDPFQAQFCAGTLIDPRYVLTAAHCPAGAAAAGVQSIEIAIGVTDLSSIEDAQRLPVESVTVYPGYDPATAEGDVAVLRLRAPVSAAITDLIAPLRASQWAPGVPARVAGWGDLSGNRLFPDALQDASVPIVSDAACAAWWGQLFHPPAMICAGGGRSATCAGDSGGPMVITTTDGSGALVGVTSAGPPDCPPYSAPALYARLDNYRAWIYRQLGIGVPGVPAQVVATPGPGDGVVSVTWQAPASTGGRPITDYRVALDPGGRSAVVDAASAGTYFSGLAVNTAYRASVEAASVAGIGPAALTSAVNPSRATRPSVTQKLTLRVSSAKRQRAIKRGSLSVRVRCGSTPCTVKAAGKLFVRRTRSTSKRSYALRAARRSIAKRKWVTLHPRLTRRARREARRALRAGRRSNVRLTITATKKVTATKPLKRTRSVILTG